MSTRWNQNSQPFLDPAAQRPRQPKEPLWKRKWVPFAAVGFGMLLVGVGIGSSGKGKPADAAPAPAVTVTASPSPAPTVTKEVTKTVEVTPASCLEALDLSEQGFTLAAEAMGYMSDGMTAAGNLDITGLTKANANLEKVNPKLSLLTQPMKKAAADCKAGAK
jgi:hypothetical protein